MGGYTTGLSWTPEEEEMILSGMKAREISEITGRPVETIHSKRTNMRRKGNPLRPLVLWRGNNSISHRDYPGPSGWTPDMRAPCRVCGYHNDKMVALDDGREKLRDECALCTARQIWDRHESGDVPTVAEDENYDYSESVFTDYV